MKQKQFNFKAIKGMLTSGDMKQIKGGGEGEKCGAFETTCSNCPSGCSCPIACTRCSSNSSTMAYFE